MKKLTLVLLAIMAFSRPAFSQATISVEAPLYDGYWSALIGPNGLASPAVSPTLTYAYNRACYLIPQSELTRLIATNSVVTDFGFDLYTPGTAPVNGQFTLYIQNTSDVTYTKGLNFSTIISGMPVNYSGAMTLPGSASTATTSFSIPLSSTFTYTGGGIYVAWDWYTATPTSTNYVRYFGASDATALGATAQAPSAGPAPAVLTSTLARPVMRFKATNTATNEVSVISVKAPGTVSKMINPGFGISALIRNNSINALTNVPVTLTVTGANPYTTTFTVPTIAAGSTLNVNFTPYIPTVNGTSTLLATVPSDQHNLNNIAGENRLVILTQSASCTDYGNNPPVSAGSFVDGNYGFGNPYILATPYMGKSTGSITEVKFIPGVSSSMCGVVTDASGAILATTNTITAATPSVFTSNLKFTPPFELTANTQYYYGIAQIVGNTYLFATMEVLPITNLDLYYPIPLAGGSVGTPQNQMGYIGMQAVLSFSNLAITANASQSVVCKNESASVTLNSAGGALTTYTWTRVGSSGTIGNTNSVVVTPTVSGTTTLVTYQVSGTDGPSGCKSNVSAVTVTVSACTAISSNNSDGFDINLYPNPAVNGKSTISGLVGNNTITVINTLGQVVLTQSTTEESTSLDVSSLPSGNYIVKITSSTNQTRMVKLMNQH